MMILMTIFFLSVGGIYGQNCRISIETECFSTGVPEGLPRNKEELDNACKFLKKAASCMARVADTCLYDTISSTANQIVASLERVCDPESSNYNVIANNIECISSTLPTFRGKCHRTALSEKQRKLTFNYAVSVQNKDNDIPANGLHRDCIDIILDISCFTLVASEECGGEIFQPTLQTMMEVFKFNLDAMCTDETIEGIPRFASAFADKESEQEHNEIGELLQAPYSGLFTNYRK